LNGEGSPFRSALADETIGFSFRSGLAAGFFFGGGAGGGCGFGGFFSGRGCFLFFGWFGIGEIFFAPLVAADAGLVDGAAVDDYILDVNGLEGGAAQVVAGGLEGEEEKSGDFGIHLAGGKQAHDLHEGDLDGVGILEDGEDEGGAAAGAVAVELDLLFLKAFVEEAEAVAFECGRAALGSINFEMLTTRDIGKKRHSGLLLGAKS
jgi:hypothetical protein